MLGGRVRYLSGGGARDGVACLDGLVCAVDGCHDGVDPHVQAESPTQRLWLRYEQTAAVGDHTADVVLRARRAKRVRR